MLRGLPAGQQKFILSWIIGLVVLYGIVTVCAVLAIDGEKRTAQTNHALRMSADKVEPGLTPPDPLPATGDFVPVSVGLYLDDVDAMSIRDSSWSATFYVWFRWKGDKTLDPAKAFQLVEARVDKREVVEQYFGDDGTNYQRVRVTARMFKVFNTTRVPLDDHLLTIAIEDGARDGTRLRYVVDDGSAASSRVKITGYKVLQSSSVVKNHTYRSNYGDPRMDRGTRKTFTQFVFGLGVKRASMGLYFKLLIGLFAGISLTLCSFYIRPSDTSPRFSLPTASYFGAVANTYLVSSTLPSSGQFGLIDYVTGLGLFTIFVCVAASLFSGYQWILKKDEPFSRAIDQATRRTMVVLYLFANVVLPFSAFSP
jgi:hypothetical protein